MVFHGNDKSESELRTALTIGVGRLVVDSFDELDRIEALVQEGLRPPRVLVRVTPGVEAHTHEYIATGADDSKFGFTVATGAARDAAVRVAKSDSMELVGLHCHIGSQILLLEPFAAPRRWSPSSRPRSRASPASPSRRSTSVAGSVSRTPPTTPTRRRSRSTPRSCARASTPRARSAGLDPAPRLTVEAGRSIVGPAAVTLYTVGTIKEIPSVRTYVAVDGGMSDNPRPATYGARYEAFVPARAGAARPWVVTVAGKHCEQGDLLVRDAHVPADLGVGDVLATPVTGAYTHSMSSNYNLVPRPAVVFVRDGHARVVVRRETFEDLVARDVIEEEAD